MELVSAKRGKGKSVCVDFFLLGRGGKKTLGGLGWGTVSKFWVPGWIVRQ